MSVLFGCGLAFLVQFVTLVRVIKGSKHTFVIRILVMLMLANLAFLADETIWINELKTSNFSGKKDAIDVTCYASGLFLFNVAHWMFAQRYFEIARQVPFKLAKREVPRNVLICDRITNWVFLTLNSIPPIVFGVT